MPYTAQSFSFMTAFISTLSLIEEGGCVMIIKLLIVSQSNVCEGHGKK